MPSLFRPGSIVTRLASLMLFVGSALPLPAQVSFFGSKVQVHGFFSQGYAKSNQNNFLTMKTQDGSAAMTDGGLNMSWSVNDKFRVGAQAYSRNIGDLGNGQVQLDWAVADYRFKDWFGVRAGKVKTPMGLFNDTQDMEFLHTWAMLPQAVYPLDLRALLIAHVGGDIYGNVDLKKFGSVAYQAYAGMIPDDRRGGYAYGVEDGGFRIKGGINGRASGFDFRWTTPLPGLTAGFSMGFNKRWLEGNDGRFFLKYSTDSDRVNAFYADYSISTFRFNGEYRTLSRRASLQGYPFPVNTGSDEPSWFLAGTYRVNRKLEIGTYRSQYDYNGINNLLNGLRGPGANYITDQTATARLDLNKYWNVKVEGHFMDGFGNQGSAHGFYVRTNRAGVKPTTNMLVLRTGWNF